MTAFFPLITAVYISFKNQVMKISENFKTNILIWKNYESFYHSPTVKVFHMLPAIIIFHMTQSLARIHFLVMHCCLLFLGLLPYVSHWNLSMLRECNQKEKRVIPGNQSKTSVTEAFLNWNIYFFLKITWILMYFLCFLCFYVFF